MNRFFCYSAEREFGFPSTRRAGGLVQQKFSLQPSDRWHDRLAPFSGHATAQHFKGPRLHHGLFGHVQAIPRGAQTHLGKYPRNQSSLIVFSLYRLWFDSFDSFWGFYYFVTLFLLHNLHNSITLPMEYNSRLFNFIYLFSIWLKMNRVRWRMCLWCWWATNATRRTPGNWRPRKEKNRPGSGPPTSWRPRPKQITKSEIFSKYVVVDPYSSNVEFSNDDSSIFLSYLNYKMLS
jgi:hypothetical protein